MTLVRLFVSLFAGGGAFAVVVSGVVAVGCLLVLFCLVCWFVGFGLLVVVVAAVVSLFAWFVDAVVDAVVVWFVDVVAVVVGAVVAVVCLVC